MPVIAVRVPQYISPGGVLLLKMPNLLPDEITPIAYFWFIIAIKGVAS